MPYSSDTGERIYTEVQQYDADKAHNALDAMNDLPHAIARLVKQTIDKHSLEVTEADLKHAVGGLDDVFSDLFAKEWVRLMRISGEANSKASYFDTLMDALAPHSVEAFLTGKKQ